MTKSKTSNSQYIGFDGVFKLDARIEEKIARKTTVTNFYLEDGSSASDHVIVEPLTLSITGEVSNVTFQKNLLLETYRQAREQLGNIGIYTPNRTLSMISKVDKILNTTTNAIRKVEDIKDKLQKIGAYGQDNLGLKGLKEFIGDKKNLETEFIRFVEGYSTKRKTMQVETKKYGTLENMIITNYSISTNNEDEAMSYTIDLQELRTVKTLITPIKEIAKNATGTQAGVQTQDAEDKGVVQGVQKSLLSKVFG